MGYKLSPPTKFNDLPVLVKGQIFKYLPTQDRISSRLVCHAWNSTMVIYSRLFKSTKPVLFNNGTYQGVLNSSIPIESILVEDLSVKLPISSTRNYELGSSVRCLEFGSTIYRCWKFAKSMTRMTTTTGLNMKKLIELLTGLETLKFIGSPLINVENSRFFCTLRLEQLKNLEIELIGSFSPTQHKCLLNLTECAKFPCLAILGFGFSRIRGYTGQQYSRLYVRIYEFIGRHRKTLTELKYQHPEDVLVEELKSMKGDGPIDSLQDSKICDQLDEITKLSRIEFGGPNHMESVRTLKYERHLASIQTQLRSIHLSGKQLLEFDSFRSLILANQSTLEELDTSGMDEDQVIFLNCSWLKDAKHLRRLTIIPPIIPMNIEDLPTSSLQSLTWSLIFSQEELAWIITNLSNLHIFVLRDFNVDIGLIDPLITVEIIMHLRQLTLLHLDCPHTVDSIRKCLGAIVEYEPGGKLHVLRK